MSLWKLNTEASAKPTPLMSESEKRGMRLLTKAREAMVLNEVVTLAS